MGLDNNLLEVSGTLEVFPRRTLLAPPSLLLPTSVPIRATLLIGVNGPLETGEVELVVAKWVSVDCEGREGHEGETAAHCALIVTSCPA